MIYKGLRYSDIPTTNQKVVGSNPAGLTNGKGSPCGSFFRWYEPRGAEATTCKGVGRRADDHQWVRNARKTVQWTVFSGERAAAPGEISSAPFSAETGELPGGESRRLRLRFESRRAHQKKAPPFMGGVFAWVDKYRKTPR